jgi:hypothetical protein
MPHSLAMSTNSPALGLPPPPPAGCGPVVPADAEHADAHGLAGGCADGACLCSRAGCAGQARVLWPAHEDGHLLGPPYHNPAGPPGQGGLPRRQHQPGGQVGGGCACRACGWDCVIAWLGLRHGTKLDASSPGRIVAAVCGDAPAARCGPAAHSAKAPPHTPARPLRAGTWTRARTAGRWCASWARRCACCRRGALPLAPQAPVRCRRAASPATWAPGAAAAPAKQALLRPAAAPGAPKTRRLIELQDP